MNIAAEMRAHPYTTGALGLVGLLVVYMLMRGQQAGISPQTAAAQQAAADRAYNLQEQQLTQAGSLQAQQVNAQLSAVNAQAQAANNQTIANVQAQYNATDAALIAALAQAQTTQQYNQIQGQAYTNQLTAELAAQENTNQTNLSAYGQTLNYQSGIANLQAGLTSQAISASKDVATQQLQNNYNLSNQVLNMVGQAGLNHGTSALETQLASITAAALGNSAVGVAAQNTAATVGSAQAAGSAATQAAWANTIKSLSSDAFSTLF